MNIQGRNTDPNKFYVPQDFYEDLLAKSSNAVLYRNLIIIVLVTTIGGLIL